MQLLKTLPLLAATALIALASCNNSDNKSEADSTKSTSATSSKEEVSSAGRYEIKSGIIEYTTNMPGMGEVKQTETFDGYGDKQVSATEIEMMGKKIKSYSLIKDGYIYSYNEGDKTGTKIEIPEFQNINFRNLSDSMRQRMNIKEEGEETFLGKTAKKYSLNSPKDKMSGHFLIWKGIPLKSDISVAGTQVSMVASKVEENASIPASVFEFPAGIEFKDIAVPQ